MLYCLCICLKLAVAAATSNNIFSISSKKPVIRSFVFSPAQLFCMAGMAVRKTMIVNGDASWVVHNRRLTHNCV